MKFNISFEGDYYEDIDEFKLLMKAKDYKCANDDARNCIREYLKYREVSEETSKALEEISELLYVED